MPVSDRRQAKMWRGCSVFLSFPRVRSVRFGTPVMPVRPHSACEGMGFVAGCGWKKRHGAERGEVSGRRMSVFSQMHAESKYGNLGCSVTVLATAKNSVTCKKSFTLRTILEGVLIQIF